VKFIWRNPVAVLGLVILWRVVLLVFTAQPIPANDAAFFDGAIVNWLTHGGYFNPGLSVAYPISGHQVFSAYPPLYQMALLVWMKCFGVSVISAMALHVALFVSAATLCFLIIKKFFPAAVNYSMPLLFLLAFTFDDRPEALAHNFGLFSLLLVGGMIVEGTKFWRRAAITLVLLATLYTSVIVGAFYFGAGFLAVAAGWLQRRKWAGFIPFILAAILFAVLTFVISRAEPLWWAGFQENARTTSVETGGLRIPSSGEIFKLVRNAPVFLLALVVLPICWLRRERKLPAGEPWLWLTGGVAVIGWALLLVVMVRLAPNYLMYVLYGQVVLAAGLLGLQENFSLGARRWLQVSMVFCAALVSIRAVGMSTWGVACAWENSQTEARAVLQAEFAPFIKTNAAPVLISSAFLYQAIAEGVKTPVHSDWYFDRAGSEPGRDIKSFLQLRPARLVLTQFDYYRDFKAFLERVRLCSELTEIRVRNLARVRPPDSIPSLQRVLQHISWAPVIVELDWKESLPVTNSAPVK